MGPKAFRPLNWEKNKNKNVLFKVPFAIKDGLKVVNLQDKSQEPRVNLNFIVKFI